MNNADDLKFEKRLSGKGIVFSRREYEPDNFDILVGDQVKLKYKSKHVFICIENGIGNETFTGMIKGFEGGNTKFNELTIGKEITFQEEHVFFRHRE